MSAEVLRFAHARDNLLRDATLSLSTGIEQAGYELANLVLDNWAVPLKINETAIDLRIDLGAAQIVGWAILGNTNLTVAARLQGHSDTASWAGTTDVDETFDIPVMSLDGLFTSPHLVPGTTACRYWRLTATGNTDPIIIGELVFAATQVVVDGSYGASDSARSSVFSTVVHTTPAGIELAYELAPRREVFEGSVAVYTSEESALRALWQSTRGSSRPFWMVLPLDPADAFLVRAIADPKFTLVHGGSVLALPVRELSRGLPWVDPDA